MVGPQPSINILGVRIDEPMATLTDVILAVVCFFAYYKLTRKKNLAKSQMYFRYYLLMMGVATFLGGVIGHGFLYALSFGWKLPGWVISIFSVALIERSSISHAQYLIKPKIGNFFLVFNIIEMIAVLAITLMTLDFKWVQFHSGYGLLVIVAAFHGYTYYRTRDKGSLITVAGVAITSIASIVYSFKLSLHTWFNYLDISHTLLAIAAYVLYLGAINHPKRDAPVPVEHPLRHKDSRTAKERETI